MDWLPPETTVAAPSVPLGMMGLARSWVRVEDNSEDATLLTLIQAAIAEIEQSTDIRLFEQTIVLRRACFANAMRIPVGPVQSISGITYLDGDGDEQTLAGSTYNAVLTGKWPKITLAANQSWPAVLAHPAAITLTAVVGHSNINRLPANLRLAIEQLIAHWFVDRAPGAMPVEVADRLAAFRLPRI